jgi:hypothetical protein
LYLLSAYRGVLRQNLVRSYFPDQQHTLRVARRFDTWAGPLAALINWLALVGSMFGRRICWRGIEYRFLRGRQVCVTHGSAGIPAAAAPHPGIPKPLSGLDLLKRKGLRQDQAHRR